MGQRLAVTLATLAAAGLLAAACADEATTAAEPVEPAIVVQILLHSDIPGIPIADVSRFDRETGIPEAVRVSLVAAGAGLYSGRVVLPCQPDRTPAFIDANLVGFLPTEVPAGTTPEIQAAFGVTKGSIEAVCLAGERTTVQLEMWTEGDVLPTRPSDVGFVEVEIAVAAGEPLGDAVVDVELRDPATGEVEWRQRVSSSQFGDGAGRASVVGPCTVKGPKAVRVELVGVFADRVEPSDPRAGEWGGPVPAGALETWGLPAVEQGIPCQPSVDVITQVDVVAALRPADVGGQPAVDTGAGTCTAAWRCPAEGAPAFEVACRGDDAIILMSPIFAGCEDGQAHDVSPVDAGEVTVADGETRWVVPVDITGVGICEVHARATFVSLSSGMPWDLSAALGVVFPIIELESAVGVPCAPLSLGDDGLGVVYAEPETNGVGTLSSRSDAVE
ncbi:MAG: hypothetical protein KC635_22485 [Myxococcales bacterium]|nr:hypothetical protein [Myxococcales bacterium]MCB9731894.1 hypothetical protein [Deltaproteobacteria bacterium]